MKNLKHYASILSLLIMLSAVSVTSCTEDYGPQIDKLKEDVSSLQTSVNKLKEAYEGGKIISGVEPITTGIEGWKITFSDNTAITLQNGANGKDGIDGVTPYIKIDNNCNWIVSYDKGQTYSPIKDAEGNTISAKGIDGANGISVEIQVNGEGNYEIITYVEDKSNPITVLPTPYSANPDNQITSIIEDSERGMVTITMSSGKQYNFGQALNYPTAIHLFCSEIEINKKDDTAVIEFRVNPSNAKITKEDIVIDQIATNMLKSYAESYTNPTSNYKIISLKNSINDKGEKLLGQYKLTIKHIGNKGDYEEDCMLVVSSKDSQNNKIEISSEKFKLRTKIPYTVTLAVGDGGRATTSATQVLQNNKVTFTATPRIGHEFVNWTINGEEVSTENPYEMTVTDDVEIKANFLCLVKPLPKVYVNTPNSVAITSKDIWTKACEIVIVNEEGVETLSTTTSFRGRGNSTWLLPKKPYAIKLDSKSEVLGMPKHKRWVLLANWMDRTLLRNAVTFEMARQIMDWAPRGEFVEFYLNGVHQGNYYLCEQIKIDKNRVNISEFDDNDTSGKDGGYILEFDTNYQAEINYFMSKYYNYPITIKDPDEEIISSWQHPLFTYIDNYIEETEYALINQDFETAFSKIDLSTFVDFFLIQEISGNWECNHPKSSYMYKDAGGKICAGPVWDFDWATYKPGKSGFFNHQSLWYKALFKSLEFKSALKARWIEVKHVFEDIDSFIDEKADLIRVSEDLNHEMWPIDSRNNYPNGDELIDFDSAVERMKQAIDDRIIAVDNIISGY